MSDEFGGIPIEDQDEFGGIAVEESPPQDTLSPSESGIMSRLRRSTAGRAILGPTPAEREAIASGDLAGAPGGQIGILPMAQKMLEFTSLPEPLRPIAQKALDISNATVGDIPVIGPMSGPLAKMPLRPPSMDPMGNLLRALGPRGQGAMKGIEEMAISMPIAPLPGGVAGKTAMGVFGAEYVASVPELLAQRKQALEAGDTETAGKIEAQLAGGAALNVALPAFHVAAGRNRAPVRELPGDSQPAVSPTVPGPEAKGQLPIVRGDVQTPWNIDPETVSGVREPGQPNAPQGLQQATGSEVVMRDVPQAGTSSSEISGIRSPENRGTFQKRTFEVNGQPVEIIGQKGPIATVRMPDGEVKEFLASSLKETTPGLSRETQGQLGETPSAPAETRIEDFSPQEQKLLTEATAFNKSIGLSDQVAFENSPDQSHIARIGGNGELIVNKPKFQEWVKDIPARRLKNATRGLLTEEGLHSVIQSSIGDSAVAELWNNLTGIERSFGEKSYRGKNTEPLSDAQLGHEYVRRVSQWANKVTVREVAEASTLPSWITEKGIDVTLRGIHEARKALANRPKLAAIGGVGDKLRTDQTKTMERMLDRIQSRLESAKSNTKHWEKQKAEKAEQLFALSKTESNVSDLLDEALKTPSLKDFRGKYGGGPTGKMWEIGSQARTPEDVAALRATAERVSQQGRELMKQGDFNGAMALVGKQPAEAYEWATGVKLDGTPKWETFEQRFPDYKPPVPDAKYLEAKGEKVTLNALDKKGIPEEEPLKIEDVPEFIAGFKSDSQLLHKNVKRHLLDGNIEALRRLYGRSQVNQQGLSWYENKLIEDASIPLDQREAAYRKLWEWKKEDTQEALAEYKSLASELEQKLENDPSNSGIRESISLNEKFAEATEENIGKINNELKTLEIFNRKVSRVRGNDEQAFLAARSKKNKLQEGQGFFDLPFVGRREEVERPTAQELGAIIPEPPSLESARKDAVAFFQSQQGKKPNYKDFEAEMRKKHGDTAGPFTQEAWVDAVWSEVQRMPEEDLQMLNDRLTNKGEKEVLAAAEARKVRQGAFETKGEEIPPPPERPEGFDAWQKQVEKLERRGALDFSDTTERAKFQDLAAESARTRRQLRFGERTQEQVRILQDKLAEWETIRNASAELNRMKRNPKFSAQVDAEARYKALKSSESIPADVSSRRGQRRAELMADTAQRLIRQMAKPEMTLERSSIGPEEIGWEVKRTGEAWQEFDAAETKNTGTLKKALTQGSRVSGQPESVTRRVTSVRDNLTGEVVMVSTYKTGGGDFMIVNPEKVSKRPNTSIDNLLREKTAGRKPRYTVLATTLITEPVKNYKRRFDSEEAWRDQFANEASARANEAAGLETEAATQSKLQEKLEESGVEMDDATPRSMVAPEAREAGGVLQSGKPLTDAESKALLDSIYDEVNTIESVSDIADFIAGLRERASSKNLSPRDVQAVTALEKMYRETRKQNPDMTPEDAYKKVINTLDEDASSLGAEEFAARQRERYVAAEETIPPSKPVQTGARELTMRSRLPPTVSRGEVLPKGPGPAPTLRAVLKPAGKSTVEWIRDVIREPARAYSEWMVERLQRVGGPIIKASSETFNWVISREKDLYGGLNVPIAASPLDPAAKAAATAAASRMGLLKSRLTGENGLLDIARRAAGRPGKATTWLHRVFPVTPRTGVVNAVNAIEGATTVPAYARDTVLLGRMANVAIGKVLEPIIPGFVASGKFQRNLTAYGYDVIRSGSGRVWNDWAEGLAAQNNLRASTVKGFFRKWKSILDEPGIDANRIERINQDFARTFPKVITHVKVGDIAGGRWESLIHSDLFSYLETAARRATHTRSFRESYPNTPAGKRAFDVMQNAARTELAPEYQADWDALMRSMQGHPTDTYSASGMFGPGKPLGEAGRLLNQTVGNVLAKMVLSGQMIVQPGENIAGSTPVFLGSRNYLRGLAAAKQLYPQLEMNGAVNRVMYDFSFDPTSPIRSAARITGNTISKVFMEQFLNEMQEAAAASTARVVSDRLQAGTLTSWERRQLPMTLKAMGFTKAQVADMMAARSPELLAEFERKAATFLSAGNKAIAEGSKLGANRLLNSLFRFQSYPMMKMNQLRKVLGNVSDAFTSGSVPEKVASAEQLGRFVFGNTLQGALTVGIVALAYEGMTGAQIRGNEAKDEPLRFLVESYLSSMSGPLYLVWRGARDRGLLGVGEQATRLLFPYSIVRDLNDATTGKGQYANLDAQDRLGKFVSQKLPGTKALMTGLSVAGLSQENKNLDTAIKAYRRWSRSEMGFSQTEDFLKDEGRKQFRVSMKKAVEALKKGDTDGYRNAIAEAAGQTGVDKNATANSLRARKILRTPDGKPLNLDQMNALRKRIGVQAVDRLQYFDMMLERAADGVVLQPY